MLNTEAQLFGSLWIFLCCPNSSNTKFLFKGLRLVLLLIHWKKRLIKRKYSKLKNYFWVKPLLAQVLFQKYFIKNYYLMFSFLVNKKKSSQLKIKRTKYQKWIFPFFHHHHHHFRFLCIPSSSGRHLSKCAHLIIKLLAKINRPASKPTDSRWNNILRKKKAFRKV